MVFTHDAPADVAVAPPRQRRWGLPTKIAGGILAVSFLLAIGNAAVKVFTPEESSPAPVVDVAVGSIPGPKAPPIPDSGACAAFAAPTGTESLTDPPVTIWSRDGGMAVPYSADAGPALNAPVNWCFAPTPTGALFAAANYAGQMVAPGMTPQSEITLARFAGAATPDRDALLAQWAVMPEPVALSDGSAYTSPPAQFVGFRFDSYDPTTAVIEIAVAWTDSLSSMTYTLVREAGDWKLQLPADGRFPSQELPAPLNTARFTPWTAQVAG